MDRTKGGSTQNYFGRGCFGLPIQVLITAGPTADCTKADRLIEELNAEYLLADRVYDRNEIINQAISNGIAVVIPPRKSRKAQRFYILGLKAVNHLKFIRNYRLERRKKAIKM